MGRWDEMKLFKRGPFRRGAKRPDQVPEEDKSIGSNLSEADRFDIIIPLRTGRILPLFGRDEGSEISSITTDDRHHQAKSPRRTRKSPRGALATCCCAGSSTTKAAANESVAPKGGASAVTGATPLVPLSTSSVFDWVCCGQAPIEEKIKRVKSRRGRNSSVTSLVPTNSLFDSVMSDDEQDPAEVITVSSKKKSWRLPGKLRGLPWRRRRYDT